MPQASEPQNSGAYPHLFAPLTMNSMQLANRCAVSPMTRVSATRDGRATREMAEYSARFARGGFALVMTEGTYPDESYSQGYYGQPGIANREQAQAWRDVVARVHDSGAPIFLQLMHAGALVQGNRHRDVPVAPSAVKPKGRQLSMYGGAGEFTRPMAMTETDIIEAVDGFVVAAQRAREAGFDGVELHGANGYLLDQFLTTYTNQREDDYGGGIGNRVHMPRTLVRSVRDAVGADYPVGIRLSQTKLNDGDYRWPGGTDDAALIFRTMAEAGASYLHVTGAGAVAPAFGGGDSLAALAKRHGGVAVIANGGLDDPARAEAVLAQGDADLVALARGALANPDWPTRIAAGQTPRAFSKDMLAPLATLENQRRWEHAHGAP